MHKFCDIIETRENYLFMKKIILLFFAILLIATQKAYAETIKFIQVTDAHVTASNQYSQKVLKSTVQDINKQQGVSFVVFTGDSIDTAREDNLKVFLKIVNQLNIPYYIALGNHDVYKSGGLSKTRYFELIRQYKWFFPQRKPNYKFSKNKFNFYIVDGAKEIIPGPVGYYKEDTLKWLDKQLSKNSKRPAIIFQHYPLVYPENSEGRLKTHKTYKANEYLEMLNKHDNVLAVISGHFHRNSENMQNGVYHISSPSLLNLPHYYKIIDIVTTKEFSPIIYTQLREVEVKE